MMFAKQFRCALVLLGVCLAFLPGCLSRQRFSNYGWQLDSLRYYTLKADSVLAHQSKEIANLYIDFYTKSGELSDKMEMLSSRISDNELQLTRIYEKIGVQQAPADSEDISKVSPEARLIYESAYVNYVKGNYTEAISGFESYLKIAPDSPLSDNALYWIGESYAALGKRQNAIDALRDLISKYPDSNKKPTALYKIGIIYEEAGDAKTARSYYEQILKEFPNSPEAALVKTKVQR